MQFAVRAFFPKISLILAMGMFASISFGQVSLSVTTDKNEYEYGDLIEVQVAIYNNTEHPFQLSGSSSCQAQFTFDSIRVSEGPCTADYIVIDFRPGSWRGWNWTIDPSELGLPNADGEHTVVGFYPGSELADTLTISAPAFLGGKLQVSMEKGPSEPDLSALRDSLNATVLSSWEGLNNRHEEWQIVGMNAYSVAALYAFDNRFLSISPVQWVGGWKLVDRKHESEVVKENALRSVYPNPCVSRCNFEIEVSTPQTVSFRVVDMLGRVVHQWNESLDRVGAHHVSLDLTPYSSGPYILSARGAAFTQNRMIVKK